MASEVSSQMEESISSLLFSCRVSLSDTTRARVSSRRTRALSCRVSIGMSVEFSKDFRILENFLMSFFYHQDKVWRLHVPGSKRSGQGQESRDAPQRQV